MNRRNVIVEFVGTLLLIVVVVGSGIMGERLSGGNVAIALLANAIATGGGLFVLVSVFGAISGAHFNPAVSTYFRFRGELSNSLWAAYVIAQVFGAIAGIFLAHFMFELPVLQVSTHSRDGLAQMTSEFVATTGLLLTIVGFVRYDPTRTALGVASYITAAYWFTSSTSFANPAVTIARSMTNSFAGIAPHSVIGYIVAQLLAVAFFVPIEASIFGTKKTEECV